MVSELEQSAEPAAQFQWAMARAGLGICVVSPRGELLSSSRGISRMLGYTDENASLPRDLANEVFVDADDFAAILAAADDAAAEWMETRWKRRDGSVIVARLAIRRVNDAH